MTTTHFRFLIAFFITTLACGINAACVYKHLVTVGWSETAAFWWMLFGVFGPAIGLLTLVGGARR
jgi:hypothetical protein